MATSMQTLNQIRPGFVPDESAPSWQSRCLNRVLQLLQVKQKLASAEAVRAHVRRLARRPASHRPTGLGEGVDVTMQTSALGWPVYVVTPSQGCTGDDVVVFLHGGGYINEIVRAHWRFVAHLVREARIRCVVPIFPLAPRATAIDLVPGTGELLRALLDDVGAARLTLMGNSAGAGLALAAAQWLRNSGYRQPHRLVLVSPALDATFSRPEQVTIATRDPMLAIPGLVEAGLLYAGDLEVAHPYVSPLNGDFRDLAPILAFAGTRDLLYPDSIELASKARAAGVPIELHLKRDQPHNYPALPTPEGRQAREIIVRALG